MDNTILVLLSSAAGAAFITLIDGVVQFFLQRHAKKEDAAAVDLNDMARKVDAMLDCQLASTLDRIQFLCKTYLRDGEIDMDDLRRLHIMHEKYHNIGGNGDLDKLMEQVNELHIKV